MIEQTGMWRKRDSECVSGVCMLQTAEYGRDREWTAEMLAPPVDFAAALVAAAVAVLAIAGGKKKNINRLLIFEISLFSVYFISLVLLDGHTCRFRVPKSLFRAGLYGYPSKMGGREKMKEERLTLSKCEGQS